MLEQYCNYPKQCCNTVLRLKSSLRIVSCNIALMLYKGWLSFTKFSGCVQFTVYVYRSSIRGDILHFNHQRVSAENHMATRTFRASLREVGGPQVGEVTCDGLPHLKCKRDHIKMRDYIDRRVTPHKRVTSPTWGPPSACEQALTERRSILFSGTYWS